MNILILFLLILAMLGLIDEMIGDKLGLAKSFNKGIQAMGNLALSMLGFYCIAVTFVSNHVDDILQIASKLHIDASVIVGCLLAPDLGGFSIVHTLTNHESILILIGIVLTSTIGTVISFQLPIFLTDLSKDDLKEYIQGLVYGIIVIPFILIPLGLYLEIPHLFKLILPVIIICLILLIGLALIQKIMTRLLELFGESIRIISLLLFGLVVLQAYFTNLQFTSLDLIEEALFIVFKCSMIVSGSMILCDLVLKYCSDFISHIANKLNINEYSVIGLFLQLATSIAMLPLFSKMDSKGKKMNAAFSVAGAYVLGAQLGFITSVTSDKGIFIYMFSKLLCGIIAVVISYKHN